MLHYKSALYSQAPLGFFLCKEARMGELKLKPGWVSWEGQTEARMGELGSQEGWAPTEARMGGLKLIYQWLRMATL